ncbi:MAG: STAS domain-containing protein, partial [Mycobacterium sp.]
GARKERRSMMAENQPAAPGSPPQPDKDNFSADESWVDRLAVVSVSGSVDMLSAPWLADAIDSALGKSPDGLIVDLSKVEFLGSAGISVLMKTNDGMGDSTRFCVVAHGPVTHRPLTLLGINETMSLCQTLDNAVSKLADG